MRLWQLPLNLFHAAANIIQSLRTVEQQERRVEVIMNTECYVTTLTIDYYRPWYTSPTVGIMYLITSHGS